MERFTVVTGVAAPLIEDDVNTDQIAPLSAGHRVHPDYAAMFFARRRAGAGIDADPDFFLSKPRFSKPSILAAGANFGCGSSRESAVWCIQAAGIRCVVARGFADIFRENCLQNGLLPVVLAAGEAEAFEALVIAADGGAPFTVDLAARKITAPGGREFVFDISPADAKRLLEGLDDIGLTLTHNSDIAAFEQKMAAERPWSQRADISAVKD